MRQLSLLELFLSSLEPFLIWIFFLGMACILFAFVLWVWPSLRVRVKLSPKLFLIFGPVLVAASFYINYPRLAHSLEFKIQSWTTKPSPSQDCGPWFDKSRSEMLTTIAEPTATYIWSIDQQFSKQGTISLKILIPYTLFEPYLTTTNTEVLATIQESISSAHTVNVQEYCDNSCAKHFKDVMLEGKAVVFDNTTGEQVHWIDSVKESRGCNGSYGGSYYWLLPDGRKIIKGFFTA